MKKIGLIILLVMTAILSLTSCKKKKHNWREVGNDVEATREVKFGAQAKDGTPSEIEDSVPLIVVYVPKGNGKYQKALYEVDKITPESITEALQYYGVIDSATSVDKYHEEEVTEPQMMELVGPGAKYAGEKKTKIGTITLRDFAAGNIIGDDGIELGEAAEKKNPNDPFAAMGVYLDAATETYRENLNLLSCDVQFE